MSNIQGQNDQFIYIWCIFMPEERIVWWCRQLSSDFPPQSALRVKHDDDSAISDVGHDWPARRRQRWALSVFLNFFFY